MATVLIAFMSFFATGCIPRACDPNSTDYDEEDCRALQFFLVGLLSDLAYGERYRDAPYESGCRLLFRCTAPYCTRVDENSSFEAGPVGWSGDRADTTRIRSSLCHDETQLAFVATTPAGTSESASSQVFQVFPYSSRIPEAARANVRRLRAQAFFTGPGELFDHQFGLHIAAYAGNPSAFPAEGDPDTFPENTAGYRRLALAENTLFHDSEGLPWQGLLTTMMLPDGTDFFVVFLQAYENVDNNSIGSEFFGPDPQRVDNVRVGLDTGNTRLFASDDRASTDEDVPVVIPVLDNDYDVDSRIDVATLTVVGAPANGVASVGAVGTITITYTPNAHYVGTDLFSYIVADDEGVFSGEATVTVEVRPVNDAPVAAADVFQRQGDTPLTVDAPGVLGNDTDIENDALTAVLVDDVNNGTLALGDDGSFTYTPDPGFLGDDVFSYLANDGADDSNEATVTIQRLIVPNQPPTANDDQVETIAGTTVTIDVLDNDTDPDGSLDPSTVTVTSGPNNGAVTVRSNGTIRYTPDANFVGTDRFTYTVADDDGAVSNEATVTVEVFG